MKIFDLHSDIFTDIVNRRSYGEKKVFDRIHYPRLKAGGVDTLICAVWVEPAYRGTEKERFQQIVTEVKADLDECQHVHVVTHYQDLQHSHPSKINVILGIEGVTFMEQWEGHSLNNKITHSINYLNKENFQHAILIWDDKNMFANSSTIHDEALNNGVSTSGEFAINHLSQNNWLIDVSHLNDQSFWDIFHIVEKYNISIMASHSNVRALCNHPRNLTDDQIKAIASTGGIIGVNAFGEFVQAGQATLSNFIDHIVYISNLVGVEHVGFGFDFMDYLIDYGLDERYQNFPKGIENVTMIPNLLDEMIHRGFSNSELESICFQNAFQFYKKKRQNLKVNEEVY